MTIVERRNLGDEELDLNLFDQFNTIKLKKKGVRPKRNLQYNTKNRVFSARPSPQTTVMGQGYRKAAGAGGGVNLLA